MLSDQQISRLRNGASRPTFSLSSHVGSGSALLARQCPHHLYHVRLRDWHEQTEFTTNRRNSELRRSSASCGSTNAGDLVVEELVKDGSVNLSGRIAATSTVRILNTEYHLVNSCITVINKMSVTPIIHA